MKSKILGLLAAGLLGSSGAAQAVALQWILTDISFASPPGGDTGTASGSFFYDADANVYSDILIVTSAGSVVAGSTYTRVNPLSTPLPNIVILAPTAPTELFQYQLILQFAAPLTSAGGAVGFDPVGLGVWEVPCIAGFSSGCTNFGARPDLGYPDRRSYAGSVVAVTTSVPEPGTLILLGLGLAGLGLCRRRKAA